MRWSLKNGHEEKKTSFHRHSKGLSLVPVTIPPAALRPTSGRKEPEIICQLHVESFPYHAKVINADRRLKAAPRGWAQFLPPPQKTCTSTYSPSILATSKCFISARKLQDDIRLGSAIESCMNVLTGADSDQRRLTQLSTDS